MIDQIPSHCGRTCNYVRENAYELDASEPITGIGAEVVELAICGFHGIQPIISDDAICLAMQRCCNLVCHVSVFAFVREAHCCDIAPAPVLADGQEELVGAPIMIR